MGLSLKVLRVIGYVAYADCNTSHPKKAWAVCGLRCPGHVFRSRSQRGIVSIVS